MLNYLERKSAVTVKDKYGLAITQKKLHEDKIGHMILTMQNRNNSINFYKCYQISVQNESKYLLE